MSLLVFIYLIGGFVLLVIGAEVLVRGAARLAARFGISPLIIGLTVQTLLRRREERIMG